MPYFQFLRPAQRYNDFKLIRITCQAACHGKTEHGIFVKFKKTSKTASQALHRTIWCRSTFGPRGPGLSNPTSFLRPALPMAPTRDDNARDKQSKLRLNPATFSRDFTLYMTAKYAIIRKRCLNYPACLTVIWLVFPFGNIVKKRFAKKFAAGKWLNNA